MLDELLLRFCVLIYVYGYFLLNRTWACSVRSKKLTQVVPVLPRFCTFDCFNSTLYSTYVKLLFHKKN